MSPGSLPMKGTFPMNRRTPPMAATTRPNRINILASESIPCTVLPPPAMSNALSLEHPPLLRQVLPQRGLQGLGLGVGRGGRHARQLAGLLAEQEAQQALDEAAAALLAAAHVDL